MKDTFLVAAQRAREATAAGRLAETRKSYVQSLIDLAGGADVGGQVLELAATLGIDARGAQADADRVAQAVRLQPLVDDLRRREEEKLRVQIETEHDEEMLKLQLQEVRLRHSGVVQLYRDSHDAKLQIERLASKRPELFITNGDGRPRLIVTPAMPAKGQTKR